MLQNHTKIMNKYKYQVYKAHQIISCAPISGKSEMCIIFRYMQNIFVPPPPPLTCQERPLYIMITCIYYYTFVIRFKNNYVCVTNIFFFTFS